MIDDTSSNPWRIWRQAAEQPVVDAALRGLYERVAEAVQRQGPVCWASGRCCHFETYGHRLYVTGLEIAWVLQHVTKPTELIDVVPRVETTPEFDGCPFQQGHLCGMHAHRPLGCRLFFCQRGTDSWQHELYEIMLGQLRQIHDEFGLPYQYMEWRTGLREAGGYLRSRG